MYKKVFESWNDLWMKNQKILWNLGYPLLDLILSIDVDNFKKFTYYDDAHSMMAVG